ncbi:MAG: Tim44 domain-containing protein [Burkholderiales bacterium]|nr:Tim44 domain-containing protein [Burkholderiales bacterium]
MKTWLIGALVLALAAPLVPGDADARRLGGGKSTGTQRSMPERTSPSSTTPPTQPAHSPTAAPGQQAAAPAAAAAPTAAAAAGKRSWLGPIAGLAAGLGLAALMSHLGLGEAFANFLMLALLAVAVIALVAFIRRRMAGGTGRQPALAGAAAGAGSPAQVSWPAAGAGATPLQRQVEPTFGEPVPPSSAATASSTSSTPLAPAFVPAAFDSEGFERIAKAIFIRMQAANDAANLDDLRQFTTPEMFAELKVDLLERGAAAQATEVKSVEARVIDMAEEGEHQVVSVRYRGEVVEAVGAAAEKFDEVWHLVRPRGSQGGWVIAGIEQMQMPG